MKRICFFVTSYYVFENFLTNLTNKLTSNYRVSIIGNFETDEILFMKELGFEKVYNIPIKREIRFLNDIKTIFKIIKILKKEKYNIIHSISPKAGFFFSNFLFFF